jgi:hypothetical protein
LAPESTIAIGGKGTNMATTSGPIGILGEVIPFAGACARPLLVGHTYTHEPAIEIRADGANGGIAFTKIDAPS